ncbi:hypothetical protein CRE_25155 [Caenorhabditis remanei]|uniref:Serpentine receptor class gamma n=1 Tax=Caenorhabditis remanei TaxID=31234 RepID=E3LT85_CAERE|nr:hypothetical protein CRE_25155 [Caenorhabditis remanei]
MICPDWLVTFSRVFSLTVSFSCVIVYMIILLFAMTQFKKYHVFFITLYMAMVFTRLLALLMRSSGYFLILYRESVPYQIYSALWIAKFSAQAAALGCILERSYATFYATNYENSKRFYFISLCVVTCTICCGLSYVDSKSDLGRKINTVCFSIFSSLTTIMLVIINRRFVKKSSGAKCNLSERYQLSENIKALR